MSAPAVLLVHGFASSFERNWREPGWVDLLEDAGRQVVALDLPGHGEAPKPHDPADYADLPGAVEAALPGEPVDAVGFSLGAALLLSVAARAPERFHRLVVGGVGANLFRQGDPEVVAQAIETGAAAEGAPPLAATFARFARSPGNDPAALAACLRRPSEPLRPEQLADLDRPVLIVLGERDPAGPAEPLVAALPQASLRVLRGVDHFGTARHVGFLEAALDFLDASPTF